jgi:hypothetical protein
MKQPNEQLDYDLDFTLFLPLGDSITSTTVSVTPAVGLSVGLTDGATAIPKLWISGGVNKEKYKVSALAVTSQGRTKEVNFQIKIKDT